MSMFVSQTWTWLSNPRRQAVCELCTALCSQTWTGI